MTWNWLRRARCMARLCSGADLALVNERHVVTDGKKNKEPDEFFVYAAQCQHCGRIVYPDPYCWANYHKERKDEKTVDGVGCNTGDGLLDEKDGEGGVEGVREAS